MFSRRKILVVEDNELNRSLLCQILISNYDVLEAENGEEALKTLKQYGEGISLILLDIVMPVMDGYTFLSIMKADPSYSFIPVIVTTQNDGESDEVAALSHGATDFVAKPYKPQIILHRVASIINLRETAAMINQIQYDQLTGLYSKAFFFQRVKEILLRNPDRKYDIICSDIENFKLINDVFGIPTGDRLLQSVADMYKSKVKDIGICGRLNSDRFVCLLEHNVEYTNDMFNGVSADVNSYLEVRNIVIKWGIYYIDDSTISVEQMCDRALLAAHSIKGQYGKYFAVYDDQLRNQLLRDQAITDSMEDALADNQFLVYLQPKYRIKDENLVGAEALVRWIHPELGFQAPDKFIPLFEKNGFITKLDQYIWDKTCALIREWDDTGHTPIAVSVNVSRADIYNADLADILIKIIEKYDLAPSRLHLEITESAYTENPKQIIDTVNHLRELGFIIEMDDFGSGYSSLNMLNEMPIDILKLDMKFIQNETAKPNSQGILQFIIDLARWMHVSVVAEGVETKEQLNRLSEIGCDYVQGYYFARPLPQAEFEKLLSSQGSKKAESELDDVCEILTELPVLLIADEDKEYCLKVRKALRGSYQVIDTSNKEETFEELKKHNQMAAVVVSLALPNDDGFKIISTIQSERQYWNLPVMASAEANPQLESKALDTGADDFIFKPHNMDSLLKRVQRLVREAADQRKIRELQNIAYKDHLTGLLNRRGLEDSIKSLNKKDMPAAIYIFNLDDLKYHNAECGHSVGDQELIQFGLVLRTYTGEKDLLARIGGDEFVVVSTQVMTLDSVKKLGDEICIATNSKCIKDEITWSCSAGVAIMNEQDNFSDVLENADKALYIAKRQYKGSCCFWKEGKAE